VHAVVQENSQQSAGLSSRLARGGEISKPRSPTREQPSRLIRRLLGFESSIPAKFLELRHAYITALEIDMNIARVKNLHVVLIAEMFGDTMAIRQHRRLRASD
jgi:hypothetical protein